jgi:hypothetical protein
MSTYAARVAGASVHADPRIVLLERAAARLRLVYSADLTLDQAIDGLADAFAAVRPCPCEHATGRVQR